MIEIVPAILPLDFEELQEKLSIVCNQVPLVQIDVCDGVFVPRKNWPYVSFNPDSDFQNLLLENKGFPFWEKLDIEVDLMVSDPEEKMNDWITIGASRLIVHIESTKDITRLLKNFRDRFPKSNQALSDIEIGLALGLETSPLGLEPYLDEIDFVQCMGIAQIGYQGQAFDNRVIEMIKSVLKMDKEMIISVDGGVNLENASTLIRAGASRLVVGSAIFEATNPLETIRNFQSLATKND